MPGGAPKVIGFDNPSHPYLAAESSRLIFALAVRSYHSIVVVELSGQEVLQGSRFICKGRRS